MNKNFWLILLLILPLTACTLRPHKVLHTHDWQKATREVVRQYSGYAARHLKPAFKQAHIAYPPKQLALLAFKKEQRLELWAKDTRHRRWHYIKDYDIKAKSGGPGPKLKENDHQIPEGLYRIAFLDPFSRLHLSMKINYPNAFDKRHAAQDGRTRLGGDIFIHGKKLSAGCLAVGDAAIDELFVLVARVGTKNTRVIIAPNDLRLSPPMKAPKHFPKWVHQLDRQIANALHAFPLSAKHT